MERRRSLTLWLLAAAAGIAPAIAADRIGDMEFFGYKGIDLAKIRPALPVREGDEYSGQTNGDVRRAVMATIGKEPTDVAAICCDEKGNLRVFIGLPGASYKSFIYNAEPKGKERLPSDIVNLYSSLNRAIEAAVRRGAAEEDDSNGYALIKDPAARAMQLEVRRWALKRERQLERVLEFSSTGSQRSDGLRAPIPEADTRTGARGAGSRRGGAQ